MSDKWPHYRRVLRFGAQMFLFAKKIFFNFNYKWDRIMMELTFVSRISPKRNLHQIEYSTFKFPNK